ncbi:MAG: hypothetical protein FJ272_12220, partial [Planctomycetes bacterium]|nr:hypothetical protein [Planctomycetota bacterium]
MLRATRQMQKWLRTHQKKFLGFLAVFLMAIWLPGATVQYLFSDKPAGVVLGQPVTPAEFNDVANRWRRWRGLLMGDRGADIRRDFVWRQIVLVKQAEAAGVVVTDAEVNERMERIEMLGLDFRKQQLSDAAVRKTLHESLLVEKLRSSLGEAVKVTTDEAWQRYARDNEQVKIKYLVLRAADLLAQTTATESEVEACYEQHKDAFRDEAEGKIGYKEPERVKVEYIMAKYDDLAKRVSVTDAELRDYYEKNKDAKYQAEEPKKPETPKDAKPEAKATEPAKPEAAKAAKAEGKAEAGKADGKAEAKSATADKPETPKPPVYKPFESVKAEIGETLRRQKAEAEAVNLMNKVDQQIGDELDKPKRTPFAEIAKSSGLSHAVTPFFSAAEAAKIIGGAPDFADMALARDKEDPSRIMDSTAGKFIFQALDKQPAGAPLLTDIRERVEKDVKEDKALRRAVEVAKECQERMKAKSFDEGVKWAQAQVKAAASPKDGGLKTGETDFFKRPSLFSGQSFRPIPELGGNRPNVAAEAFKLTGPEIGLAVEERGEKACYLIQVAARKGATEEEFKKEKQPYMSRLLMQKRGNL